MTHSDVGPMLSHEHFPWRHDYLAELGHAKQAAKGSARTERDHAALAVVEAAAAGWRRTVALSEASAVDMFEESTVTRKTTTVITAEHILVHDMADWEHSGGDRSLVAMLEALLASPERSKNHKAASAVAVVWRTGTRMATVAHIKAALVEEGADRYMSD